MMKPVDPRLLSEVARLASGLDDAGLIRIIMEMEKYLGKEIDMGAGVWDNMEESKEGVRP